MRCGANIYAPLKASCSCDSIAACHIIREEKKNQTKPNAARHNVAELMDICSKLQTSRTNASKKEMRNAHKCVNNAKLKGLSERQRNDVGESGDSTLILSENSHSFIMNVFFTANRSLPDNGINCLGYYIILDVSIRRITPVQDYDA